MNEAWTYHKLIPYFILFYFFNGIFLPQGLLYSTLLTPMMLYFLYKNNEIKKTLVWGVLLLVPIPFQLAVGVDLITFLTSYVLLISVWAFLFFSRSFLQGANEVLPKLFKSLIKINFWLILLAIILLFIPPFRQFVWDLKPISPSIPPIPRLQLFTYEPSYYALLMLPVFLYFILHIITGKSQNPLLTGLAVVIPLVLTISFGVMGALVIALLGVLLIFYRKLPLVTRSYSFYLILFAVCLGVLSYLIWPQNPIFARIENIFSGKDTSANGRLWESFMFAKDLIQTKSVFFGVGPGQIKMLAHDMIINFYKYNQTVSLIVRIPNSMGEMLATFGIYGFSLKLFFEIYFFIKRRIWTNLYSFTLFVFIFIYQFTGSFLTSVAEVSIWMMVFSVQFAEFNVEKIKEKDA